MAAWRGRAALVVGALLTIVAVDRLAALWLPAPKTTLFVADAELGWRFRPGARDTWDGVPYSINRKGLRGPEIPYERSAGTIRLLFLGDSVTAGAGLGRYQDTLPERTAARLRELLPGRGVEAVNAGVNGYSPWQEAAYLRREGYRYRPDLVLVGFVLNDVTEKMGLVRFGGSGHGRQLAGSVSSAYDWLVHASGLARLAVRLGARIRFGEDTRRGAARAEALEVHDLVLSPDRPDVRRAWRRTLDELDEIAEVCRRHGLRVALVAFPYVFQLGDPGSRAPQATLAAYARERHLPFLDLLPPLLAALKRDGLNPRDCFLDQDHPSVLGNLLIADILADFIRRVGLPDDPTPPPKKRRDR